MPMESHFAKFNVRQGYPLYGMLNASSKLQLLHMYTLSAKNIADVPEYAHYQAGVHTKGSTIPECKILSWTMLNIHDVIRDHCQYNLSEYSLVFGYSCSARPNIIHSATKNKESTHLNLPDQHLCSQYLIITRIYYHTSATQCVGDNDIHWFLIMQARGVDMFANKTTRD